MLALGFASLGVQAHKSSDAYLQMQAGEDAILLRWDVALRDLDMALDLDADGDSRLSWGEVRRRLPEITAFVGAALDLQQGACERRLVGQGLERRVDGSYLALRFSYRCPPAAELSIRYSLFSGLDPTHRGLMKVDRGSAATQLLALDPSGPAVSVPFPGGSAAASSAGLLREGVHHILIGYDHVLFLVCLLLPVVLRREGGRWQPVARLRDAVLPAAGMVTMFTVAHSITLGLASLKLVSLPPGIIEPAIAATIVIAAADNIRPILGGRRQLFAFLFGLIHGFGFASVLGELALPARGFALALLQFNLGVEAGQLLVVAVVLALLFSVRRLPAYGTRVMPAGSLAAILLAAVWFAERVSGFMLIS